MYRIVMDFEKEIVEWNEKNLPDNTLEMQIKKYEEEVEEYYDAVKNSDFNHQLEEAADVIISAIGFRRFNPGHSLIGYFNFVRSVNPCIMAEDLRAAIKKKLRVIKKRKYVIKGEVYKHETV